MLGAGEGWAKSILFNSRVRDEFETFFHRPQTLALGVCNGCQMMSNLRELIPGSEARPRFVRNQSDRFEARFSPVEVTQSPSLLLKGMVGSQMPIAVSHGEGQVEVRDAAHRLSLKAKDWWRCALLITLARSPKPIRLTRTVRQMALPRSPAKAVG